MKENLLQRLGEVEKSELAAVHKLGVIRGYQNALRDVLADLDRPTVERGGRQVETTAKEPKTEKR